MGGANDLVAKHGTPGGAFSGPVLSPDIVKRAIELDSAFG